MVTKRSPASRDSSYEQESNKRSRRGLESLVRTVSPPPKQRGRQTHQTAISIAAAVEAGEKRVQDEVAFYSSHLLHAIRLPQPGEPQIAHQDWTSLYKKNAGNLNGCHFVVHQHDHPIAGTHYDLRLQCNPTSSISFAIMYGLPGGPNSRRLNRNATETRVHCLWNHLIETASHSTGSMLIWDTGEYELLPYDVESGHVTDDDLDVLSPAASQTQQDKLREAFGKRKVKLRLHGTRLPTGYTISLRLTKENYRSEQPGKPSRRRKRKAPGTRKRRLTDDTDDENSSVVSRSLADDTGVSSSDTRATAQQRPSTDDLKLENAAAVASDNEDETIRANNAYTGATNDIGSVHQRKWFLSIDRKASGFTRTKCKLSSGFIQTLWERTTEDKLVDGVIGGSSGFERFVVGGRDTERSIVTGRLATEILEDEGVVGYTPRGLWRPVTE